MPTTKWLNMLKFIDSARNNMEKLRNILEIVFFSIIYFTLNPIKIIRRYFTQIKYRYKRKDSNYLSHLAWVLYEIHGNDDKHLGIHIVKFKRTFLFWGKIKEVVIYSSRPGLIIGRKGESYYELEKQLKKEYGHKVQLNLIEFDRFPVASQYDNHGIW